MALNDNVLAYWKLDESSDGSGSVTRFDSTGNGYDLIDAQGVSSTAADGGIILRGASFNAGDEKALTNPDISAAASSAYTISSWIKFTDLVGNDTPLTWNSIEGGNAIFNNSGNLSLYLSQEVIPSSITPQVDVWYNIVVVYDNGAYKYFVNNNLEAQGSVAVPFGFTGINLGSYLGTQYATAIIDETGVWNQALSDTDVGFLYYGGSGNTYPFTIPAILYYNNSQDDGDWGNILNWWQDSEFAVQADFLPTSLNLVEIYGDVLQNTEGANQCFCISANFWSVNFGTGLTLQSSGVVNMFGGSVLSGNTSDGVSMHDTSYIDTTSTVGGNATLRDSSRNTGTINGNAFVYYDMGNGEFPIGGVVIGSVTYIDFPVTTIYFNDRNTEDGDWGNILNWWNNASATTPATQLPDATLDIIVNEKYISGNSGDPAICKSATFNNFGVIGIDFTVINGAVFNSGVIDGGVITGDATFNGNSFQAGAVTGIAKFTSNASLNNSFQYNGLSIGAVDTFISAVPTKKKISISSLLRLPWFINI